jgi:hypothetical protein
VILSFGQRPLLFVLISVLLLSLTTGSERAEAGNTDLRSEILAVINSHPEDELQSAFRQAAHLINSQIAIDLTMLTDAQLEHDSGDFGGIRLAAKNALAHVIHISPENSLEQFPHRLHGVLYLQVLDILGFRKVRPLIRHHLDLIRFWVAGIPRPADNPLVISAWWQNELALRPDDFLDQEILPDILTENSPDGIRRIAEGDFDLLYHGTGIHEADPTPHEKRAIQTLLEDSGHFISCSRLQQCFDLVRREGVSAPEAYRRALDQAGMKALTAWEFRSGHARSILTNPIFFSGKTTANAHFFFSSADYTAAAYDGPVIFAIRPFTRRGLDVESVLREKEGLNQKRPTSERLSLPTIWKHRFYRKDIWMLASHIPPQEIVGGDIRSPGPSLPQHLSSTLKGPGPLVRRYLKRRIDHHLWLDVLDGSNARMGTLTVDPILVANPGLMRPLPDFPLGGRPSAEKFPADLLSGLIVNGHLVRFFPEK